MIRGEYYIVQTGPATFASGDGATSLLSECSDREGAARLGLSEARRVRHEFEGCANVDGWGRRFPRILKVTTEIRPINERRHK